MKNKSGFTLMEMLIVIAIIAILIAVAIPTFSAVLERAREASDMANIRNAYAMLVAATLDDSDVESAGFLKEKASNHTGKVIKVSSSNDDKVTAGSYLTSFKIKQRIAGWQSLPTEKFVFGTFSWTPNAEVGTESKYKCLYIAMDANGKVIRVARGK